MRPHAHRTIAVLAVALGVAAIVALGIGPVRLSPGEVIAALAAKLGLAVGDVTDQQVAIVWTIRLPRVVLAALVGAALACCGAALQGVARNSLADPSLVGSSGGASLGAVSAFVFGAPLLVHPALGIWIVPGFAFAGALIATQIALTVARVDGRTSGVTLLLAGIGIAALAGAGTGLAIYLADDAALRSITFWALGSVGGASWSLAGVVAVPVAIGLVALPRYAGDLDRLALGTAEARHVGVEVDRVIRAVVVIAALGVGASVAACGIIGFIGLVVPYFARATVGPGHRALLPACALGGAILLVLSDLVARTIDAPTEIPVGIITALVGAPVLLALVRRGRGAEVMPS